MVRKKLVTSCLCIAFHFLIPSFIQAAPITFITSNEIANTRGGLKITSAGLYSFTEDVMFGQINATPITISADDVEIDLGGKTLRSVVGSGQNIGINIVGPRNNIVIKNGTIDQFNRYGVLVDAGVRNIKLENLTIINAPTGFSGTTPTGVFFNGALLSRITEVIIQNCRIIKGRFGILANATDNVDLTNSTLGEAFSRGIEANDCNLWDIINCQISNQRGSDTNGSGGLVANGCSFWHIISSDFSFNTGFSAPPVNVIGASFVGLGARSGDHVIENCTFCNNGAGSGLSRGLALVDTHSCVIRNCIANGNFSLDSFAVGFYLISESSGNLLEHCVANGNHSVAIGPEATGFSIEGTGNCLINCHGEGNSSLSGTGGSGFFITSLAVGCLVQNCKAVGNFDNGFISDSTLSSLIGNYASGNPGGNYVGAGTFGFITILNGAQPPGGTFDERQIDNIEVV